MRLAKVLLFASLIGVSSLVFAVEASACSYVGSLTGDDIIAREIRGKKKIVGTLHLTKGTEAEFVDASRRGIESNSIDFEGVLTDTNGHTMRVAYHEGGLTYLCNPLTRPHSDARGTFYLKRTRDGWYEIVHWVEAS